MTLKISFNEYYVNPILIIIFIPKVPTSCGNSSILICNSLLKGHSSRKYLFEIVGHASRILSKASVSIFENFRQWVKGRKERSSLGDTKSGFLYSSKIRWYIGNCIQKWLMYDLKYTKIRKNQIFYAHDNSNFSKILHNLLC